MSGSPVQSREPVALDSWESILRGKLRCPTSRGERESIESLRTHLNHRHSNRRRYRASGPNWDSSPSDRSLDPRSIQSFSLDRIQCRDAVCLTFLLYNGSTTTDILPIALLYISIMHRRAMFSASQVHERAQILTFDCHLCSGWGETPRPRESSAT